MASIAFHGLVLLVVGAGSSVLPSVGLAAREAESTAQQRRPRPPPSCEADEALATAARLAYCASPLTTDKDCFRQAVDELAAGRVRCHVVEVPTSVALVDPAVLDEIEPEPLVELLAPEQVQAIEEQQPPVPPPTPQPQPQPPAPPPPQRPANTQVVEVTRPENEEAPDNARFVSEYNTRVDKETVARGSTEEMVARPDQKELKPVETPRPASARETPEEPTAAVSERPDAPKAPGALSMRAPGTPATSTLPREATTPGMTTGSEEPLSANGFQISKGNSATREKAQEATDMRRGEGGGGGGQPLVPNLRPTEEVLERALGGGSVDKLDHVEQGEFTALNSKQWKFATFFNRMKRQIAQNWNPTAVISRRDPSGKVYGSETRVTYLQVSLDTSGAVVDILIVKRSGIDELDQEAIRAIRAAQPFPNPPEGLMDPQTQRITFPFGFHLDMAGRNDWRIFRYR